ncbi:uncharacterized protein B0I36DRAFT_340309 [Microdochium trichocladiopsis]|uniref:Uncharacterized protein n=1 Tax=Microdochium trichocladiopsis TaxID=1682393 RepID=A0A9P8XRG8_9PEZI|nr:uncharacterized protein B0I36DRAFT_340309 [Microdochium trichocladiopsis]KAH7012749.1 hypothetical protein B0I36DRAFT_340309 [Microdochium trichocladiopsis]
MVQALQSLDGWEGIAAYKAVFLVYAVLGLVKCIINMMLSSAAKANPQPSAQEADPESDPGLLPDEETRLLPDADTGSDAQGVPTPTSSPPPSPKLWQPARSLVPYISPASHPNPYPPGRSDMTARQRRVRMGHMPCWPGQSLHSSNWELPSTFAKAMLQR